MPGTLSAAPVWSRFRSRLRMTNLALLLAETVVAQALRNAPPEYVAGVDDDDTRAGQVPGKYRL